MAPLAPSGTAPEPPTEAPPLDPTPCAYAPLIHDAAQRIYEVCHVTPMERAQKLSARLHNTVLLKREDKQPIFSFKLRGAYNKMCRLSTDQRAGGVVTCSAGNHAQGVALSAFTLGIDSIIVMPLTTPMMKIDGVKHYGQDKVHVVLFGASFAQAMEEARRLTRDEGRTFVHPFDDPLVIAGQGTVGLEILDQLASDLPDYIFIPIGGGGLCAGVAAAIKHTAPHVKIIGVEPVGAACMARAMESGHPVTLPHVDTFAEGVAVATAGVETFRVCKGLVDEMVLVSVHDMSDAIRDVYNDTRTVLEPAGAVSVAGMTKYVGDHGLLGARVVCITSGANMDFVKLAHVVSLLSPTVAPAS